VFSKEKGFVFIRHISFRDDLESDHDYIAALEEDNLKFQHTITRLENEIAELKATQCNLSEWKNKVKEVCTTCLSGNIFNIKHSSHLTQCKDSCRQKVMEITTSFEEQIREMTAKELDLQKNLDEVNTRKS
jgi:hypothetical protein